MKERRVVVTGIGALTPLGNNLQDYWSSLVDGVSGAAPITRFDATKFKTRFACEVKGFDASEFIHKKEARKLDRFSQFALVVSEEAIQLLEFDSNGYSDPLMKMHRDLQTPKEEGAAFAITRFLGLC